MTAMKKERVSWETYFMNIAAEVATRSTCDRKHVGAVIVKDKTILSTGYNGRSATKWWTVIAYAPLTRKPTP